MAAGFIRVGDKYEDVMFNLRELVEYNRKMGYGVKINIILRCDKPYDNVISSFYYRYFKDFYNCEPRIIENWDNWTGLIKKEDLPLGQDFRKIVDTSKPCSLFYKGLIILANGDVGACWCRDLEGMLIVGNIYQNTLEEIWQGDKMNKLREGWWSGQIPEICKNCLQ